MSAITPSCEVIKHELHERTGIRRAPTTQEEIAMPFILPGTDEFFVEATLQFARKLADATDGVNKLGIFDLSTYLPAGAILAVNAWAVANGEHAPGSEV